MGGIAGSSRLVYNIGMDGDTLNLCCGGKSCPIVRKTPGGFELRDAEQLIALGDADAAQIAYWILARVPAVVAQPELHSEAP